MGIRYRLMREIESRFGHCAGVHSWSRYIEYHDGCGSIESLSRYVDDLLVIVWAGL